MYFNNDIEELMQNTVSYVVKDKCKEVACRIVAENEHEHDLHAVARRINKMWLKRRDLIKAEEKEELEEC